MRVEVRNQIVHAGDVLIVGSAPARNAARQRRPAVIVVETHQKQSHGPRVHRDISSRRGKLHERPPTGVAAFAEIDCTRLPMRDTHRFVSAAGVALHLREG